MLAFKHVAVIGKYHATASALLDDIAQFVMRQGVEVSLELETAASTGLLRYNRLSLNTIGTQCDLALVLGGDGTMLGIGRQLASFGVPLVGINQGRLGFITDISLNEYQNALVRILKGECDEDARTLIEAQVIRDGHCVFKATAMNDVVVNRGSTAGMVELRIEMKVVGLFQVGLFQRRRRRRRRFVLF